MHSDLNNFYAACECALNPSLKEIPFAVSGSVKDRHGIVLAKNEIAKAAGVKTAMTLNEARNLCPNIQFCQAHFDIYTDYSERVRKIYLDYTDRVEPFGIDEAWLDVTGSKIFGSGEEIAEEIRRRVKELGLTVSVGVSFNKVFAKLGSDMKKPDATTVISEDNFRQKVWGLDVGELLMVGRKTRAKLNGFNIHTIGDLADFDRSFLERSFGKMGGVMHDYANGLDFSIVKKYDEADEIKSVGNSMTCYRDITDLDDARIMFSVLAESVSSRALKKNLGNASTLSITVRTEDLESFTRQMQLVPPSSFSDDIFDGAMALFEKNYSFSKNVRSLGVAISDFTDGEFQLSMFDDPNLYEKKLKLAKAVGGIRDKYGNSSLTRGVNLKDKRISREDPEKDHVIHPKHFDK